MTINELFTIYVNVNVTKVWLLVHSPGLQDGVSMDQTCYGMSHVFKRKQLLQSHFSSTQHKHSQNSWSTLSCPKKQKDHHWLSQSTGAVSTEVCLPRQPNHVQTPQHLRAHLTFLTTGMTSTRKCIRPSLCPPMGDVSVSLECMVCIIIPIS